MRIGVFAVLFGDKPFEETLDYLKELGLGRGRNRDRRLSGQRALQARRAAAQRPEDQGVQEGHRRSRPRDQRAELPRQSAPSRQAHRQRSPQGVRADGAPRQPARRRAGDHVQRLPGRRSVREAAELDHRALAARVHADARLAVEGTRDPLLEGNRPHLQTGWRARRHRDASQLHRLQPGDDAAAAGCGEGHDRLQLRSEPHVLAAGRRRDGDSRARRLHLSRAREGLQNRSRRTRRSTASSTRRSTPTRFIAPGSSAPSATATARASGATS